MNLEEALHVERSKEHVQTIVDYIGQDKDRFAKLLDLMLHGEDRIPEFAAWPLGHCGVAHPKLFLPHLKELLDKLKRPNHQAVNRAILRVLQQVDIPEDFQGQAYDTCFEILCDRKASIAERSFAMGTVYNIAQKQPELLEEVRLVLEDLIPHGSAGFKSKGKKILKAIRG